MKNILHIAAILIVIVIGGLGVMKSTENPSSSFKIYVDMDSSGLIEAGRIPNYLPRSAYEIDETHNIDSKIVKYIFDISLEIPRLREAVAEPKLILTAEFYLDSKRGF